MVLYSVPIIVGESWGMCSHLAVSWYWLQRQHFRTRHNMCAWQVQVVGSYARAWQAIRSVVTCVFARTNCEPFLYVLMHRAFCVALGFGLMCLATTAFGAQVHGTASEHLSVVHRDFTRFLQTAKAWMWTEPECNGTCARASCVCRNLTCRLHVECWAHMLPREYRYKFIRSLIVCFNS